MMHNDAELWSPYWGKAQPASPEGGGPQWHPLVCHCLDVAATAMELLRARPRLLTRLAELSVVPEATLQRLLPFLIALHDAGKFADNFQALVPELATSLRADTYLKHKYGGALHHATVGYHMLVDCLEELCDDGLIGIDEDTLEALDPWLSAVTGHHGRPPRAVATVGSVASESNSSALRAFALQLAEFLDFSSPSERVITPDEDGVRASSWLLAGLCVTSDWLGSSQDYFPYALPLRQDDELQAYWHGARSVAAAAVEECGLGARALSGRAGMEELYPCFDPSPLQHLADSVELAQGPQLFIVEEIAGGGKTEATLVLASRLLAAGLADGLYFALPTMATANGLYPRIRGMYADLFAESSKPSLVLAHGAATLQAKLERRRWRSIAGDEADYPDGEMTATAHCGEWIADSRKRCLLADVGVGTIDQALLSVLPVKHGSIRQLGLLGKVLVVDEVHAYDPYMLELLKKLLEQHARHGGSAVLLSATMPQTLRAELATAYRKGRGMEAIVPRVAPFPLLTHVHGTVVETPCAPREGSSRSVRVTFMHAEQDAVDMLTSTACKGRCGVWIRNTVVDAIRGYEALCDAIGADNVILFHARFCLGDRLAIEKRVLADFGADSTAASRAGKIVVATQVVEQSLDLDFDEMVTDLAPVDLVVQRAGRLRRHPRNPSGNRADIEIRGDVSLHVLCSPWLESPPASWLSAGPVGLAEVVYRNPGTLWRTQRILRQLGQIRLPEDARLLIESVYGEQAPPIPEELQAGAEAAVREASEARTKAFLNGLPLGQGYVPDSETWESDENTPTRLSEPTQTVQLAVSSGKTPLPFVRDEDFQVAWQLSSLSVACRKISGGSPEIDTPKVKFAVTVVMREEADGSWTGEAENTRGPVTVLYSRVRGLEIKAS